MVGRGVARLGVVWHGEAGTVMATGYETALRFAQRVDPGRERECSESGGMVSVISLLIALVIIGALLYLVEVAIPLDPTIRALIRVVLVVVVCLWALQVLLGVDVRLPRLR
jgi:uncharacterized protein (DUF983 family)